MIKLYRFTNEKKMYWEAWDNQDGSHTVHWGELGTVGASEIIKKSSLKKPEDIIQEKINQLVKQGFEIIEDDVCLIIEYEIEGMGTTENLQKRHRLESRMNETLGWTGLGACDGGSIGSGTMEVCNFVVDFDLAKKVIEEDLKDTEFANYTRIYKE